MFVRIFLMVLGCSWEKSLADAFEAYARKTSLPSIWFYGDNDSYWGAELPKEMHGRYTAAGGKAKMISYGVFPHGDAHAMFSQRSGLNIWLTPLEEFLRGIDMPTDVIRRQTQTAPADAAYTRSSIQSAMVSIPTCRLSACAW